MAANPPKKSWRVAAASVRGVSHIKSNLPCQDAVQWATPEPSLLLAAVSDGAGSARESERAANLACHTALLALTKSFHGSKEPEFGDRLEDALKQAFEQARDAVLTEAETLKMPIRELACTLLLLAATPYHACAMQIGDGAALILNSQDELIALTRPPETEYLNETFFLVMENASTMAQVRSWEGSIKGAALFTDGLQMLALKMPNATPHQPFFSPLFRFISEEPDPKNRNAQFEKLLTSPRITTRADDDLTLFMALLLDPG